MVRCAPRRMSGRTLTIGDIHGDVTALERLLDRLPPLDDGDTVVFLGDYLDRGPASKDVIELVRAYQLAGPQHTVTLRGNHEDRWAESFDKPDLAYLVLASNGCAHTFRSLTGKPPLAPDESLSPDEIGQLVQVSSWFPEELVRWI